MLRITQQDSAAGAKSYYSQSDYLSEGQELVGHWGGIGAKRLGLEGVVDKLSFDRLCENRHPTTGKQLTGLTRSGRTVGYDFTFSCPKSVSLLYAMTQDQDILEAFRSAVDETMQHIESEMKTRVRRGKQDSERVTGNMLWAEFIHTTSRPVDGIPDMQLHAHEFCLNCSWDQEENRWKAGQFRDIKRDAPYFQAAFRVRLASKLQDLGFAIERKKDDFELAGVSDATIRRFSRRTEEIEKTAAEQGITDPDRKGELGAKTREKKSRDMSWGQLRKEWYQRLTEGERKTLATIAARDRPAARPIGGERLAVDHAIQHCFAREAAVPERKLLTHAMQRGLGTVTVKGVENELANRSLIRGQHQGRTFASADFVLAEEKKVVDYARDGRGRFRPLGHPGRKVRRDWLNAGQKAAIAHVLSSRDAVSVVRGVAGTGKTTLEQELGEALSEAGHPVVALAEWSRAVEVLQDQAGFKDAATVARFLKDERLQESASGGVILVDEASQVSTQDMLGLFNIAGEVGARVVLVGDRRQHHAVARGEPLKLLEEKAGLPVAEVSEILRQSGDYRQAVKHLSEGRVAEGLEQLDKLGWIREVPDANRYEELAAAYVSAVKEKGKDGKQASALVVTPTHAEAARIAAGIRGQLKAEGKLKDERVMQAWAPLNLTDAEKADPASYHQPGMMIEFFQNVPGHAKGSRLVVAEGQKLPLEYAGRFQVYRPVRLPVAIGERLRVTASGKTKVGKHKLSTGRLFTVKGFTPHGDLVADNGWVIAGDGGHLAQGYAVTSHASQGSTVDKLFIGQSSQSFPASNERQAYVSASRGRKQAVIFTDSKKELLKAVEKPDQPLSAMELAEMPKRKLPFKSRLKKHLAFIRRTCHDTGRAKSSRSPSLRKEQEHVR